jgi:GTP:adenosylcobinamide-phosphate guanylyltransferase
VIDSIVLAGGTLKAADPLYEQTGVEKKALIPLLGQPMIVWVLDAIRGSGLVENIAIVGLEPQDLDYDDKNLFYVDLTGGIVDNAFAGLHKLQEVNPSVKKILIFSSDIPLITPKIVQGFVGECGSQEADMYYAVVEEKTMEASFPDSKRTFVPFKDGRFSGGDALLVDVEAATGNTELARSLTGSRKNYVRQARFIGLGFILRFLFRTMTVHEAAEQAAKKGNLKGQVVVTRFPELGMDVDKASQYELIKSYLERRQTQATT